MAQRDEHRVMYDGPDLSGDYLNVGYTKALLRGDFDERPDCGHLSCGMLCDVLIRRVRRRRAGR